MTAAYDDRVLHVRHLVRQLLEHSDAFDGLDEATKRTLAMSLVRILDFLSDPYAGLARPSKDPTVGHLQSVDRMPGSLSRSSVGTARAQAQASESNEPFAPNEQLQQRLAKKGSTAGQDFAAGATNQVGKTFKDLVGAVDFPKFVSGLIEGVFTSIVKSSIKQMQAFSQMLESISKSVDQFAKETISDAAAREYLRSSYPNALEMIEDENGTRRIRLRDGVSDADTPNFQADLGLREALTPSDPESEAAIVLGAQLKMARQRQQQLSTMVLMGINRIVVTEGEIKASVLFDVKSKDKVRRDRFANTSDTHTSNRLHEAGGGWFDDSYDQETEMRVSSAYSDEKEQSVSELEAKAKLSGSVTVKFKSETFPLERFANSDLLGMMDEKGRT